MKSKLSTAKKSKTTTFSRVFHPKKPDNREIEVEFLDKNQDFEQFVSEFKVDFIYLKGVVQGLDSLEPRLAIKAAIKAAWL